jgi:hypothetical protein
MKKFLFFLFVVVMFITKTNAQDTVRTLIHPAKIRNFGLYFAPEYQYGQSNAAFNSYSGGSGMVIFNKRLAIGVAAYESVTELFSPKGVAPLTLKTAYGGAKLEYTVHPDAAVHISFPLLVGMGEASMDSVDVKSTETNNEMHGMHGIRGDDSGMNGEFFVIQPGINVEANLLRNVKLFAGANYRIASKIGTASTIVPKDALIGFGISAGVRVGIFDVRKPNFHVKKFGRNKKIVF